MYWGRPNKHLMLMANGNEILADSELVEAAERRDAGCREACRVGRHAPQSAGCAAARAWEHARGHKADN